MYTVSAVPTVSPVRTGRTVPTDSVFTVVKGLATEHYVFSGANYTHELVFDYIRQVRLPRLKECTMPCGQFSNPPVVSLLSFSLICRFANITLRCHISSSTTPT